MNLTIRSAALPTLYQMTCEGPPPRVEAREGIVRMWQRHGRHSSRELSLSSAVPWEVQVNGGALRLAADLHNLSLSSLHISGGVSQTTLLLPEASGTVPVRVDGGVNGLRIERPPTSAIRLHLRRGSSHITLDGLRLGAAGGGTEWESPDYATAGDRYYLEMGGDVNELSISTAVVELVTGAGGEKTVSLYATARLALERASGRVPLSGCTGHLPGTPRPGSPVRGWAPDLAGRPGATAGRLRSRRSCARVSRTSIVFPPVPHSLAEKLIS